MSGESLSSNEPIDRYKNIVEEFPVWSIEDGMGGHDTIGWRRLTDTLGDRVQLVGDDNFGSNRALPLAGSE